MAPVQETLRKYKANIEHQYWKPFLLPLPFLLAAFILDHLTADPASRSIRDTRSALGFRCALRFSLHLYILATALLFALVTSFPLVVCRYVSTVGPMPKPAALIFEAAHLSQLKLPSRDVGCMVFFLHTTSFHALRNPFDIFGAISCLGLEGASFLLLNAHILLAQKEDKRHNVPRSDGRYIPRLRL